MERTPVCKLQTVAEGLEAEAEYAPLRQFDCNHGQGSLFSHPLDTKAPTSFLCEQMLTAGAASPAE